VRDHSESTASESSAIRHICLRPAMGRTSDGSTCDPRSLDRAVSLCRAHVVRCVTSVSIHSTRFVCALVSSTSDLLACHPCADLDAGGVECARGAVDFGVFGVG
jgi:hypothetical protein